MTSLLEIQIKKKKPDESNLLSESETNKYSNYELKEEEPRICQKRKKSYSDPFFKIKMEEELIIPFESDSDLLSNDETKKDSNCELKADAPRKYEKKKLSDSDPFFKIKMEEELIIPFESDSDLPSDNSTDLLENVKIKQEKYQDTIVEDLTRSSNDLLKNVEIKQERCSEKFVEDPTQSSTNLLKNVEIKQEKYTDKIVEDSTQSSTDFPQNVDIKEEKYIDEIIEKPTQSVKAKKRKLEHRKSVKRKGNSEHKNSVKDETDIVNGLEMQQNTYREEPLKGTEIKYEETEGVVSVSEKPPEGVEAEDENDDSVLDWFEQMYIIPSLGDNNLEVKNDMSKASTTIGNKNKEEFHKKTNINHLKNKKTAKVEKSVNNKRSTIFLDDVVTIKRPKRSECNPDRDNAPVTSKRDRSFSPETVTDVITSLKNILPSNVSKSIRHARSSRQKITKFDVFDSDESVVPNNDRKDNNGMKSVQTRLSVHEKISEPEHKTLDRQSNANKTIKASSTRQECPSSFPLDRLKKLERISKRLKSPQTMLSNLYEKKTNVEKSSQVPKLKSIGSNKHNSISLGTTLALGPDKSKFILDLTFDTNSKNDNRLNVENMLITSDTNLSNIKETKNVSQYENCVKQQVKLDEQDKKSKINEHPKSYNQNEERKTDKENSDIDYPSPKLTNLFSKKETNTTKNSNLRKNSTSARATKCNRTNKDNSENTTMKTNKSRIGLNSIKLKKKVMTIGNKNKHKAIELPRLKSGNLFKVNNVDVTEQIKVDKQIENTPEDRTYKQAPTSVEDKVIIGNVSVLENTTCLCSDFEKRMTTNSELPYLRNSNQGNSFTMNSDIKHKQNIVKNKKDFHNIEVTEESGVSTNKSKLKNVKQSKNKTKSIELSRLKDGNLSCVKDTVTNTNMVEQIKLNTLSENTTNSTNIEEKLNIEIQNKDKETVEQIEENDYRKLKDKEMFEDTCDSEYTTSSLHSFGKNNTIENKSSYLINDNLANAFTMDGVIKHKEKFENITIATETQNKKRGRRRRRRSRTRNLTTFFKCIRRQMRKIGLYDDAQKMEPQNLNCSKKLDAIETALELYYDLLVKRFPTLAKEFKAWMLIKNKEINYHGNGDDSDNRLVTKTLEVEKTMCENQESTFPQSAINIHNFLTDHHTQLNKLPTIDSSLNNISKSVQELRNEIFHVRNQILLNKTQICENNYPILDDHQLSSQILNAILANSICNQNTQMQHGLLTQPNRSSGSDLAYSQEPISSFDRFRDQNINPPCIQSHDQIVRPPAIQSPDGYLDLELHTITLPNMRPYDYTSDPYSCPLIKQPHPEHFRRDPRIAKIREILEKARY